MQHIQVSIEANNDGAHHFQDGLACVGKNSGRDMEWGYTDKDGKVVIEHQFNVPAEFVNGLAFVRIGSLKDGTQGYINHKGEFVWKLTK